MQAPAQQTSGTKAANGRESPVRELPVRGDTLRNAADAGGGRSFRWDLALVWFMRVVALLWMAKGLFYWAILLGTLPQDVPFEGQPLQRQTIVVCFAVIDLVAAVGLWLTSSWGGVIWLLAALSYCIAGFAAPHAVVSGPLLLAGVGALVVAYFLLSWYASRIDD